MDFSTDPLSDPLDALGLGSGSLVDPGVGATTYTAASTAPTVVGSPAVTPTPAPASTNWLSAVTGAIGSLGNSAASIYSSVTAANASTKTGTAAPAVNGQPSAAAQPKNWTTIIILGVVVLLGAILIVPRLMRGK